MSDADSSRRRYMPLVYRVAGLNAALLAAAVVVTLLVLSPRRLSTVAVDEAIVLVAALALVGLVNLVVLRRVIGPVSELTQLVRRVDLLRPGIRMPETNRASEAADLAITFNQMLDRLEAERREATGRVLDGQEAERLRIAQELHDQIGQELTAVLLGLARVRATVPAANQPMVEEVQEAVRSSLEDVRRIALELRPEALDELGLVSALAVLCHRLDERTGLTVRQQVEADLEDLDPSAELVLYRVAQEALTNVVRHSGTDRASLTLERGDDGLIMEVIDNGRGIPADVAAGTGIRGMQERAALVGGCLEVEAAHDGRGCRVVLQIPVDGQSAALASVSGHDDPADHADPAG